MSNTNTTTANFKASKVTYSEDASADRRLHLHYGDLSLEIGNLAKLRDLISHLTAVHDEVVEVQRSENVKPAPCSFQQYEEAADAEAAEAEAEAEAAPTEDYRY